MTTLIGEGSFLQLLQLVRGEASDNVFVVTGKQSFAKSSASQLVSRVLDNKQLTYFSSFSPNAKLVEAAQGCCLFRDSGADVILAVGGGSVIDMAKIVSSGAASLNDLERMVTGQASVDSGASLYCAPTTAGSGSEATHFAVVYHDGEKYSLAAPSLRPDAVAIDPELSSTMPPFLTAVTGFDALSQAVESYWSVGATAASREFSTKAISLILPNIAKACSTPTREVRLSMAEASNLAGEAINISKTTAPHALSYYLTSRHSVDHGHAVALFLGHFFIVNKDKIDRKLLKLFGLQTVVECRDYWYDLMRQCGLETSMRALGISQQDCEVIGQSVNEQRLKNNPVFLEKKDIVMAVNTVYDMG